MSLIRQPRPSLLLFRNYARLLSTFKCDDLQVTLSKNLQPKPDNNNLLFGHHTSDHMLEIDHTEEHGWHKPVIRPVEPLQLHPAAKVFHYAIELFEGVKAYRCVDNKIRIFRPSENMSRMARTAERSAFPAFDKGELLKCIKKLVSIEQEWVPYSQKCSLYIRPTLIGTEPTLGVSYSKSNKLFVIVGPVGPYYPTGLKPVSLLADPQYIRAAPGGCGAFKMGSNYGPTIYVQKIATELGCQQVLWLYGEDHQMTEVGTMNLFVYWINEEGVEELITPPLESGLILPGVTRKSLLEIAREWNEFKVSEKPINMPTFVKALNEGRVKEVFGAGTACVVCPVNRILYQGEDLILNSGDGYSPLTQRFYDTTDSIYYGRTPHRWMEGLEDDEGMEMKAGVQ